MLRVKRFQGSSRALKEVFFLIVLLNEKWGSVCFGFWKDDSWIFLLLMGFVLGFEGIIGSRVCPQC